MQIFAQHFKENYELAGINKHDHHLREGSMGMEKRIEEKKAKLDRKCEKRGVLKNPQLY